MNIVFHVGYSASPWNCYTPGLGGTEQCVNKLAASLAIQGHSIYIVGEVKPTTILGEHNDEILKDAGYSEEEIKEFIEKKVI